MVRRDFGHILAVVSEKPYIWGQATNDRSQKKIGFKKITTEVASWYSKE